MVWGVEARGRSVACVRARERLRAHALGVVASFTIIAGLAAPLARSPIAIIAGAGVSRSPLQPETKVLGDAVSLADMVSGVYDQADGTKVAAVDPATNSSKPDKLSTVGRSGLTTTPPLLPPTGLLGAFLGAEPAALPRPEALPDGKPAARKPAAYTTVCVRLCDGAYFPVSYATTRSAFAKDEAACASTCDAPSKLFVFETGTGSPETMVDVHGHPYADLQTAFKFRTSYDPSCKCRAHPWEQEAQDRHRGYAALAAAGLEPPMPNASSVETPHRVASLVSPPDAVSSATAVMSAAVVIEDSSATSAPAPASVSGSESRTVSASTTTEPEPRVTATMTSSTAIEAEVAKPVAKTLPGRSGTNGRSSQNASQAAKAQALKVAASTRAETSEDIFRANFAR